MTRQDETGSLQRAMNRLSTAEGVMFDVDGCLMLSDSPSGHGGELLEGATEAIAFTRARGNGLVVFTNGSMQTPAAIAASLRGLGLDVADAEVLTPAVVAGELARDRFPGAEILAFGGPGIHEVFDGLGVPLVDIPRAIAEGPPATPLVVIGWDIAFGRDKLRIAAEAVRFGADIMVTSDAPSFASRGRLNVGVSGFIAAGLQHVSGKRYEVAGKPSHAAASIIVRHLGVAAEHVLVVGDDLALEVALAKSVGALSALVTTGTSSRSDAAGAGADLRPDLIVDSLTELVELWKHSSEQAVR